MRKADDQFPFPYGDIENLWLLLNDLWLVRENLKVMAAGWPEADAILPPTVFDNGDLDGEIGQSCVWIIKYSFVYGPEWLKWYLTL